jgi:hypothetical protein
MYSFPFTLWSLGGVQPLPHNQAPSGSHYSLQTHPLTCLLTCLFLTKPGIHAVARSYSKPYT